MKLAHPYGAMLGLPLLRADDRRVAALVRALLLARHGQKSLKWDPVRPVLALFSVVALVWGMTFGLVLVLDDVGPRRAGAYTRSANQAALIPKLFEGLP